MGRLKSCKSKSFGFPEAITLERELLAEVVEAGEFLVIFMVVMEVSDDAPVVEGDGFSAEVFVGPFCCQLEWREGTRWEQGRWEVRCHQGWRRFL